MARADREAVLRGVNARFDETGDDDAVIAALGSPTFAAVSVLRGYTPPEDSDGEDSYYEEEEYQYAEPASDSGEAEADSPAEPVEEAPGTAEEAASDVEAPQEAPAGDAPENAAPEDEAGAMDEPSPGQAPPEAEPERAKLRGGRVFACVLLGIIPGIPVTVILILASLALLLIGASLAYAGGVAISFAFLGMSVVADILLCVSFGLMVGAVGLVTVFLAVWFFLRCVAGLCSRVFAKAGAWCRGEVRE